MPTPLSIVAAHKPWSDSEALSIRANAEAEITARVRRLNITFQLCTAIATVFLVLSFLASQDQFNASPLLMLGIGVAFAIPALKTAQHPSALQSNLRRWEIENGYIPLTALQLSLLQSTTASGNDDASLAAQAWMRMDTVTLRQRDLVPLREARRVAGIPFPEWSIDEIGYLVDGKPTFEEVTC